MSESDLEKRLRELIADITYEDMPDSDAWVNEKIEDIMAAIKDAGYSKHDWSITPGSVQIDGEPHMTGQEWYERFEKEMFPVKMDYDDHENALEAGRRAAGIDER